jgi:hypothetical protein
VNSRVWYAARVPARKSRTSAGFGLEQHGQRRRIIAVAGAASNAADAVATRANPSKRPPGEALVDLRQRLALLAPRDPGRTEVMARAAAAYGVSIWTIYRALRGLIRPKSVRRSDHGSPRTAPGAEMGRYAEIVAALKITTSNKRGHLSTGRAIRLLEKDGVGTPERLVRAPAGLLKPGQCLSSKTGSRKRGARRHPGA